MSHSSTYTVEDSSDWHVALDMEVTSVLFRYRRIFRDTYEFGLDVPVLIFGAGILDSPLESYHNAFNFNDYGRSSRPHNEFLYEVSRDGSPVVQGSSRTRLGDIRVALKTLLTGSETYRLSIGADVELPVSNAEKGYSNGSIDSGAGLYFDLKATDSTMTFWNMGFVIPGDVRGHERIDLKNYVYGGVAVETMMSGHFSAIVQVEGQSSVYPETGISAIDGNSFRLDLGGRYYGDGRSVALSLTEDLNTTGAPDFIINLTYRLSL